LILSACMGKFDRKGILTMSIIKAAESYCPIEEHKER